MTPPTLDEKTLRQWVDRQETSKDTLHDAHARLMQATLDQKPELKTGDPLPPLWHWTYFLAGKPQSELGRDGHPKTGGFLPPVALPRRMWAGGRLKFHKPLLLGETITKTSSIKDVQLKSGRSGNLCFVTVLHEFSDTKDERRLSEEHDIVYRDDPAPDAPAPKQTAAPADADFSQTIIPSSTMLFRYSALTFNGHRIHYDRDYCRDVEGYPGLIFHGPLTATLLAGLAAANSRGNMMEFSFRAVAPLFDTAPFAIKGRGKDLWAETPDGNLAMKAETIFG